MKEIFKPRNCKTFERKITEKDCAAFDSGDVHPVYATFALARDAEWCGRLFVLEMKDDLEEGIGTYIHVNHHSPALVGETVKFESNIKSITGNEIICEFTAQVGERLIASGEQGQKIVTKEKINSIFAQLRDNHDR